MTPLEPQDDQQRLDDRAKRQEWRHALDRSADLRTAGDPSDPTGAGAGWAERKVREIDAAREKRLAAVAVTEYIAQIDGAAHDADEATLNRLIGAIEKSLDPERMKQAKIMDYILAAIDKDEDA